MATVDVSGPLLPGTMYWRRALLRLGLCVAEPTSWGLPTRVLPRRTKSFNRALSSSICHTRPGSVAAEAMPHPVAHARNCWSAGWAVGGSNPEPAD